jgi:hypothetical protein
MTRHRREQDAPKWAEELESLAAKIVAAESGVACEVHDIRGGVPGRADYTLHDFTGLCVGLLEVTSVTDPEMNRTLGSLEKQLPRRLQGSTFYWSITLDGTRVKVAVLRRRLTALLAQLERFVFADVLDHETFHVEDLGAQVDTDGGMGSALNKELYELGVQSVTVHRNVEAEFLGYIARGTTMGLHSIAANAVTTAVNHELAKADNRRKLGEAGVGQRAELFVWLDSPQLRIAAFHALAEDALEAEKLVGRPTLPDGVTSVWVSPTPISAGTGQYWTSDGGPWRSHSWTVPHASGAAPSGSL